MIRFKLKELLESQPADGINTMYKLAKVTGVRPNTLSQWFNNEELRFELDQNGKSKDVKAISVDVLNSICEAMDCKLEDVIEYVEGKKDPAE